MNKEKFIEIKLTQEQAEMLKLCLLDAINSENTTRAKYAKIFIDALNKNTEKED